MKIKILRIEEIEADGNTCIDTCDLFLYLRHSGARCMIKSDDLKCNDGNGYGMDYYRCDACLQAERDYQEYEKSKGEK